MAVFTSPTKKRTTALPGSVVSGYSSLLMTPQSYAAYEPPSTPTALHQPVEGDVDMNQYLEGGGTGYGIDPAFDATRGGGSIFVGGEPQWRGILDRYQNDMRSRINAGVGAMQANRLSNARSIVNRLGVRDPNALLGKFSGFGLTLEDLQAAANNPWSDLNALGKQAQSQRGAMIADRSARGGIRSGGSTRGARLIEENRARAEAQSSQDALQALAQGQFNASEYERNQWDQFNDRSFGMEQQLAQTYQPQEAVWDPAYGGYRAGNRVYDQNGQLVRSL